MMIIGENIHVTAQVGSFANRPIQGSLPDMKRQHCRGGLYPMIHSRFGRSLVVALATTWSILAACVPAAHSGAPTGSSYPEREIEFVTQSSVGGGGDVVARQLIEFSKKSVGKPMIVTNKPGGGGKNMENYMAAKKPDGYNLLITTATSVLWKYVQASGVDLLTDFRPIVRLQVEPNFIGVAASSPYKTFQDLLTAAKEGKVKFGGSPVGGPEYLFFYNLCLDKGIKFSWVAYGGGGEAAVALLGGDIGAAMLQASESIDYIKAGKIRYLAVGSAKQYTGIPEFASVRTLKDQGYDFVFEHWRGVHALAGTPDVIVKFLVDRFKQATETEGWKKWLKESGQIGGYLGPEEFGKFITEQDALVKGLATKANLLKVKQR